MRHAIALVIVGLAAACGGAQLARGLPVGTPDPSSVAPTPAVSSRPEPPIPPELLHLQFDALAETVTWNDLGGGTSYEVEGSATWEATCDLRRSGVGPKERSFSTDLPAATARYRLPRPKDDRLTMLKAFTIEVAARKPNGSTITRESLAYIGDGPC